MNDEAPYQFDHEPSGWIIVSEAIDDLARVKQNAWLSNNLKMMSTWRMHKYHENEITRRDVTRG